jgi:predicted ATPase/class 3 adenylate cyclase
LLPVSEVMQPSGTVTLVFTDIEGSTRLLAELGEESYREALAQHRECVRAAFAAVSGYEVNYEGDSFFYAVGSAVDAVRAVAEAVRCLAAGPVRIRVGVHTGEPGVDPPKYVGLDVHKAARIMAAAHGGQVLVSRATHDLLAERFAFRDLGEHRLKDLAAPERLYQLGEGTFPPLRTLAQTNLPVPPTVFLGRERELGEVAELLRDGVRLLTLTGPGGTGKTRLAMRAAAEVSDAFADGVWWVPLASLRDPALVLPAVAQAVGVSEEPGRELAETLTVALAGRRLLMLIDNAEHLLPQLAVAVGRLREASGPTIAVTSRERLQLTGEHVYPVPPLAESESVELFVARARALDPAFEATPVVNELCDRLDKLPLAIELAAARTAALSPAQILERLSKRLDLLHAGRDADPRQQTLRSTIEWSYDLLEPAERQLFARMSVFSGGCTLDAAEAVCEAEIDTLASLLDKSLLRRTADRYWMLDTIRELATELLTKSGEEAQLRNRHSDFFLQLAQKEGLRCRGPDERDAYSRIAGDWANLRSALAHSIDSGDTATACHLCGVLHFFWLLRGDTTEGRLWGRRVLALDPVEPELRESAVGTVGHLALWQGDLEDARRYVSEQLALSQLLRDAGRLMDAWTSVGQLAMAEGDLERAEEAFKRSRESAKGVRGNDYPWRSQSVALNNLGWLFLCKGELHDAAFVLNEGLERARTEGSRQMESVLLNNLARIELERGAFARMRALIHRSLAGAAPLPDKPTVVECLELEALVAAATGQALRAAHLFGAAEVHREWRAIDPQLTQLPHAEHLDAARVEVGDVAWSLAVEQGRGMTLNEAVAYALADDTSNPTIAKASG